MNALCEHYKYQFIIILAFDRCKVLSIIVLQRNSFHESLSPI